MSLSVSCTESPGDIPLDSSVQTNENSGNLLSKEDAAVKAYIKELKKFFRGKDAKDQARVDDKKLEAGTNQKLIAVQVCQCLFCPKIFGHSKCMLKHVYRRHAEELQLKFQLIGKESSSPQVKEPVALERFEKELKDVKETFNARLSEIMEHLEPLKTLNVENINRSLMHRSESHRSSRRNREQVSDKDKKTCECADLKEVVITLESQGKEMKKSLDAMDERLNSNDNQLKSLASEASVVKSTLSLHEEIFLTLKSQNEQIISSNKDICEQFASLKCTVSSSDSKSKADARLFQNQLKENYNAILQIEEHLKQYIQSRLEEMINTHTSKNVRSMESESFVVSSSSTEITRTDEAEDVLDIDREDLRDQLCDNVNLNIQNLDMRLGTSKLSDSEYDIKFRRVCGLTQQMSKVYQNFWELRNQIEHEVNKEVASLMGGRRTIRFSHENGSVLEDENLDDESRSSDRMPIFSHQTFSFDVSKISPGDQKNVPSISVTKSDESISGEELEQVTSDSDSSSSSGKFYHSIDSATNNSTALYAINKQSLLKSGTIKGQRVETSTAKFNQQSSGMSNGHDKRKVKHFPDTNLDSASSLQSLSSWEGGDDGKR